MQWFCYSLMLNINRKSLTVNDSNFKFLLAWSSLGYMLVKKILKSYPLYDIHILCFSGNFMKLWTTIRCSPTWQWVLSPVCSELFKVLSWEYFPLHVWIEVCFLTAWNHGIKVSARLVCLLNCIIFMFINAAYLLSSRGIASRGFWELRYKVSLLCCHGVYRLRIFFHLQ